LLEDSRFRTEQRNNNGGPTHQQKKEDRLTSLRNKLSCVARNKWQRRTNLSLRQKAKAKERISFGLCIILKIPTSWSEPSITIFGELEDSFSSQSICSHFTSAFEIAVRFRFDDQDGLSCHSSSRINLI
jgi:hypothetical protein